MFDLLDVYFFLNKIKFKFFFLWIFFLGFALVTSPIAWSQLEGPFDYPYTHTESNLTFAQTTVGIEYLWPLDGATAPLYLDPGVKFGGQPRISIGGIHFWGHADFFVSFPVLFLNSANNLTTIKYNPGVDTHFKYYPFRIERYRLVPFVGVGLWIPLVQVQSAAGTGPLSAALVFPVSAGVTFALPYSAVELTGRYAFGSSLQYGFTPDSRSQLELPKWSITLSGKWVHDNTRFTLTDKNPDVVGSAFIGVGPSSAWTLGATSSYFEVVQPSFGSTQLTSIFPDACLGYELADSKVILSLAFRPMSYHNNAFGTSFDANRTSLALEVTKIIWNYQGFQPFVGLSLNYEWLNYSEQQNNISSQNVNAGLVTGGITFGWDIRPREKIWWLLRTNLRYTPFLNLKLSAQNISFQYLEFNFIQFVFLPGYL